MRGNLLEGFILVGCALSAVTALECMKCDHTADTNACGTVTCKYNEPGCYMQIDQRAGQYVLYARCISDHTCSTYKTWHGLRGWDTGFLANDCCRTSNCNRASAVKALTSSGMCYVCEGASKLEDCKANQNCISGQDHCYMQVNRDMSGQVKMYARCLAKDACTASSTGTWSKVSQYSTNTCESCCTGANCNKDECPVSSMPSPTPTVPHRLTTGIACETCSGDGCKQSGSTPICPNAFPYCMNRVENDANGNIILTKSCASEMDCEKLWWNDSSINRHCAAFSPHNTYSTAFTCNFCCVTPGCNRDVHPHPSTLFIGK